MNRTRDNEDDDDKATSSSIQMESKTTDYATSNEGPKDYSAAAAAAPSTAHRVKSGTVHAKLLSNFNVLFNGQNET